MDRAYDVTPQAAPPVAPVAAGPGPRRAMNPRYLGNEGMPVAAPQVTGQDIEFLDRSGGTPGRLSPAETAAAFRRILQTLQTDLTRHLELVRKLSAGAQGLLHRGLRKKLDWDLDQLAWIIDAGAQAARRVEGAEKGGASSDRNFAEAGNDLTAAILGRMLLAVLLAYDGFQDEVELNYPVWAVPLPGRAARGAHGTLDPIVAGLRVRTPDSFKEAVRQLSGRGWSFDFSQTVDETQTEIEAHHRFVGWVNIVGLALSLGFGEPGPSGPGGFGATGGGAVAVSTSAVLASAESVAALRALVAIGVIRVPTVVDLLPGRTGSIDEQVRPLETSGKGGGRTGSGEAEPPSASRDPDARLEPGLPTKAESEVVREYTRGLADLRDKAERLAAVASESPVRPNWRKRYDEAAAGYKKAGEQLDAIEKRALEDQGELLRHLDRLTAERPWIRPGSIRTQVGTRVDCDAVRYAPKDLHNISFSELDAAMKRPEAAARITSVKIDSAPQGDGRMPTGGQRITWRFKDGSELVADFPRDLSRAHRTQDVPHVEFHGPQKQRLDPQGIQIPPDSTAAHQPMTGGQAAESHFAPERAADKGDGR